MKYFEIILLELMDTNFSPSSGSYVLNKFPSISQWSDTGPSWPSCLRFAGQVFWKHCGKRKKMLATSNFSFSHSVFYLFGELYTFFIKFEIVVCKLFQFGKICRLGKFIVWERVSGVWLITRIETDQCVFCFWIRLVSKLQTLTGTTFQEISQSFCIQ